MFSQVIDTINDIMDSQKVSLFILNDQIQNVQINTEQPEFYPSKPQIGKHIQGHKPAADFMPSDPKFKLDELNRIIRQDKSIVIPAMRFEKKRQHPCHIVIQIEYKKDVKGKKRNFNLIDENCAVLLN